MRIGSVALALALAIVSSGVRTQETAGKHVIRLDPTLDAIVSPDAQVEVLGTSFDTSEGPVWIPGRPTGYLLFSDVATNVIHKWTPDGKITVFLEHSGYAGDTATMPRVEGVNFRPGALGITLDRQGRLIFTASGDRAIIRLEKDGTRTTVVDRYNGKRLNHPNDIVVKSNGSIYFTDPTNHPHRENPYIELPWSATFLLKNGKLTPLITNLVHPNGIALSPDEKYLYLNDSEIKQILRYEVKADDTLGSAQMFVDMSMAKGPGGADGMKVDEKGNLFCSGPGGVWVISPAGKSKAQIK